MSITPTSVQNSVENGCLIEGTGFSVKDLENDGNDIVNCAGQNDGGWWYWSTENTECGTCYLNAKNPVWGDITVLNSKIYLTQ